MSAYYIFDNRETSDYEAVQRYIREAPATVAAFGGKYLAINGKQAVVEGDWTPVFPVIIAFPTFDQAKAWYDSEMYKELKNLRLGASKGTGVLIDGLPKMPLFVRLFGWLLPKRPMP